MKIVYKTSILMLLAIVTLSSCSKKNNVAPAPDISLLAGNWATGQWGGVINNTLIFTIDKTTAKGIVDANRYDGPGFTPGSVMFSNIKANSDGTYSCTGSYPGSGTDGVLTRSATMSLQNNNTQLTVYYPAVNSSYTAVTYVFQQSSTTLLSY